MCGRGARLAHALGRHLALLVIVGLVAALIASEAARLKNARLAADYRTLWKQERIAHRQTISHRLHELEARVAALPKKEVSIAYQARLADVRQRFNRIMRGQPGPTCPAAVRLQAPKPAARPDEAAACPMSEAEANEARAAMTRLDALQEWVRANVEGMK